MQLVLLFFIAYIFGSIPFGFLVARFKGVDIRKVGSGNIGGTNVSRILGIKWGVLVAILDITKGFLPSLFVLSLLTNPWKIVIILSAPIIGHVFPIWLGFKGGKGVACLFGVLCALLTWFEILILIILWYVILKLTKIMSLVNILLSLLLPVVLWILYKHPAYFIFGVSIDILIWYTHRSNIKRLIKGKELKLSL